MMPGGPAARFVFRKKRFYHLIIVVLYIIFLDVVVYYYFLIRCEHSNIGDEIISANRISLLELPLSSCQTQIKVFRSLGFYIKKIHVTFFCRM
jgi:hypothetical protein